MPQMFRWPPSIRFFLTLFVLSAAVGFPVVASGYFDLGRAKMDLSSGSYANAAKDYESAVRRLPWRSDLLEQAAIAMVHVDADASIPLFERARRAGALSATGWNMYGTAYWTTSRDKQALEIWLAGLQTYPSYHEFYWLIHLACRGLDDFSAERAWLERWLGTDKGQAVDHYELGLLLVTSDPGRARHELDVASSMDAGFEAAAKTVQGSLVLAAHEDNDSHRLVILGRGLGLVGQWSLAQSVFQEAVNADPQNADAWAWLGEARQQRRADGKTQLDTALSLAPNDTLVHALRGMYWKRQGNYAAALAEYRQAERLDPENPQWQVSLGEGYALTGDLISALAAYQKATVLSPADAAYWRLLAIFCADNTVQVMDVGLPAARRAAELAPKDAQVLDALGWTYAQAGLLYNAERYLMQATALAPDLALAHLHLGETYLRKGEQASALSQLKLAQQLDGAGSVGTFAGQLLEQYFP